MSMNISNGKWFISSIFLVPEHEFVDHELHTNMAEALFHVVSLIKVFDRDFFHLLPRVLG